MRKILKCVLALALLSMVFTSTVLAEGSITAGNVSAVDKDGNKVSISAISDANFASVAEGNRGVVKAAVEDVNSKSTSVVSVSSLKNETKTRLGVTSGSITPFLDIQGTANVPVTVTLNAAVLQNAKKVSVVHMKSNGEFEVKPVDSFATETVTFTLSSFSPIAFLIEYNETTQAETPVYIPSKPAKKNPVVNTAAGEVNHTNYMAYAAVASVVAVGAIVVASKKLGKNVK